MKLSMVVPATYLRRFPGRLSDPELRLFTLLTKFFKSSSPPPGFEVGEGLLLRLPTPRFDRSSRSADIPFVFLYLGGEIQQSSSKREKVGRRTYCGLEGSIANFGSS